MSTEHAKRRLLDPDALAGLGSMPLVSRQAMQGGVAGKHKSPHRGSSVEFAEYREYMPGDDLRRLDWRAYGRSDRFYVKEFEADTNLRLLLVVDASGSMRYGATSNSGNGDSTYSKFEYASRMAAMLAYVALKQGDAAGLTIASPDADRHLPPRRRASHLTQLEDMLTETEPVGETSIVRALHEVAERSRQRAMVVVFSDLFAEPDELADCFAHLRFRKHDAVAFHLLERRELDFEFDRTTRFVDLEGGAPIVTDPSTVARQYQSALDDYFRSLMDGVRKANVDYHQTLLDVAPEESLTRFLISRQQRRTSR